MQRWELCIDCDGQGKYPSGEVCKSCAGAGQVIQEDWPPYSFTEAVAAEARAASRKYWANNNNRHPVHPDIDLTWPLAAPVISAGPKTERGKPG